MKTSNIQPVVQHDGRLTCRTRCLTANTRHASFTVVTGEHLYRPIWFNCCRASIISLLSLFTDNKMAFPDDGDNVISVQVMCERMEFSRPTRHIIGLSIAPMPWRQKSQNDQENIHKKRKPTGPSSHVMTACIWYCTLPCTVAVILQYSVEQSWRSSL